jgi:hypothetical protein
VSPGGDAGPLIQEGSCSLSAECVATRGKDTPGDGFVDLTCENGLCTCRLEPLVPAGEAQEFSFRATCTTVEEADRIMLERCLSRKPPSIP